MRYGVILGIASNSRAIEEPIDQLIGVLADKLAYRTDELYRADVVLCRHSLSIFIRLMVVVPTALNIAIT